jgi:F-box protein 3
MEGGAQRQPDEEDTWSCLPEVPVLTIFSFLPVKELATVSLVCSAWNALSSSNVLWRPLCAKAWLIYGIKTEGEGTWKSLYKTMFLEHGRYMVVYPRVRSLWNRLEAWLERFIPAVTTTLCPPASLNEIDELQKIVPFVPQVLQCSLRIHNGQTTARSITSKNNLSTGLLGSYQFYDHYVCFSLCSAAEIRRTYLSIQNQVSRQESVLAPWLASSCPVARSLLGGELCFLLLKDLPGHGKAGNILVATEDYGHTFCVAEDYISWLEMHLEKLEAGSYQVTAEGIDLFPTAGCRGVGIATTRGIRIETAPLFIPERSNLTNVPPTYCWAYRVRMSMASDAPYLKARLKSRHWIITDGNGNVEEVRGPGVIGLYPVMEPGAYFQYESCCPLSTPTGRMRGTFRMVLTTGEEFDVEVPEFEFFVPFK